MGEFLAYIFHAGASLFVLLSMWANEVITERKSRHASGTGFDTKTAIKFNLTLASPLYVLITVYTFFVKW